MQDAVGAASTAGQETLFDLGPVKAATPASMADTKPRLRYANRQQATMRVCALDELIAEDHQVRIVWAYVERLDLSPLLAKIQARGAQAGDRDNGR